MGRVWHSLCSAVHSDLQARHSTLGLLSPHLLCFLSCPGDRQHFTGGWSHKWQERAKWLKLVHFKTQMLLSICVRGKQQRRHCPLYAPVACCILHYSVPPSLPPLPSSFRGLLVNISYPRRVPSPQKMSCWSFLITSVWEFLDCSIPFAIYKNAVKNIFAHESLCAFLLITFIDLQAKLLS